MSDCFHKDIPDDYLKLIWATMLEDDRHIYQVLTKRAYRMASQDQGPRPRHTSPYLARGERRESDDGRLPYSRPAIYWKRSPLDIG